MRGQSKGDPLMSLAASLIQQGLLSAEQAEAWRSDRPSASDRELFEQRLEEEDAPRAALLAAAAEYWAVDWTEYIEDGWLDPELLNELPVDWARSRCALPLRHEGRLAVATADPSDCAAIEDLTVLLGAEAEPLLAPRKEILSAIERAYYRRKDSAGTYLKEMPAETERPKAGSGPASVDLLRMADGAPVTQLVNLILLEAVKARASDVHVEPFENHLRVRYRIDGMLYDQSTPPKHLEAALTSRLKVMARMDIAEKRLPQDGMARVRVGAMEIDIRVSTVPVAEGERLVLRLLKRDSALLGLNELGMPAALVDRFRLAIAEPQGIVLVTGPTGSGKTTTLYAALRELDTQHANVMTIEEPIEYQLPSISQIQVNPRIDLTFARCLRHVLRQDPDVILVGETRDLETAEIALRASLTGHLVFTTLHTNDALGAPVRLMDMGVPPYLLSAAVRGVVAQRLVRRLCPRCRREAAITADDVQRYGPGLRPLVGRTHWAAASCDACREGYLDRVGIYEWLKITPPLAEALRRAVSPDELHSLALAEGYEPLIQDGYRKALAGVTSLAELARVTGRMESPAQRP
jgi:general secretion pathway protein E